MMNWSELPDDILRRISEKLAIPDRIRSSAVCSGWRSGSAKIPHLHPNPNRQPPLLITFKTSSPSTAHLRSPLSAADPSADPIPVPIPDPPVDFLRDIIGSSHGWLISAVDGSIRLLNPLTGSQIVIPLRNDEDGVDFLGGGDPRDIIFTGAALDSNPSRTNNYCLVLHPLGHHYRLVLFQSASNTWRAVPGIAASAYEDFVCQDGYVHAATHWGQVDTWIVTPASVHEEMRFPGRTGVAVSRSQWLTHLVWTSASREFLQVWQEGGSTKVYEMDYRDLSLSEVRSLGDRALLLGRNLSVSVSTVDAPQLRRDCVYYLCNFVDGEGRLRFRICDLSNGVTEDGFFPVDDRINLQPPLWFLPSYP